MQIVQKIQEMTAVEDLDKGEVFEFKDRLFMKCAREDTFLDLEQYKIWEMTDGACLRVLGGPMPTPGSKWGTFGEATMVAVKHATLTVRPRMQGDVEDTPGKK